MALHRKTYSSQCLSVAVIWGTSPYCFSFFIHGYSISLRQDCMTEEWMSRNNSGLKRSAIIRVLTLLPVIFSLCFYAKGLPIEI